MTEPVLQTLGLSKSFGALQASRDISLDLRPGEIHALIGPNGAGKSTLIGQIAGTIRPDAGQVLLAGEDVTGLDTPTRARRGLGRTFQVSALAMEDTVLQNALLGAVGARGRAYGLFRPALAQRDLRAIAEAALTRVGLADHAATRASDLSHGQRRQLEVAVALTLSPKLFVMDEPMAGLDGEGAKTLTAMLDDLRHEAPILLVEHDMDVVFALADRISVLVYGAIIATGTVDEIRRDPEVRRAYLGEDA
ncbi:ABC transporter ATP-binding protein [Pseudoruegeria sp. SK021]|uniref:ABC transporter ATP-binding protein n=1 Tax=Pseudoruegeria sp. SK021 TaxID=1933035 RepID=UPI000A245091|nr:ABC transporter ATP-binding protein [Pseudoruegeria sp. SK021]OSP56489.1 ABC transporter ATP-binding protein [Pseudoruegeria sp. SK021]